MGESSRDSSPPNGSIGDAPVAPGAPWVGVLALTGGSVTTSGKSLLSLLVSPFSSLLDLLWDSGFSDFANLSA